MYSAKADSNTGIATLLAETAGEELNIAAGITNGYLHEGLVNGTTYYYSIFPYIDINGRRIYSANQYKSSKQMKVIAQTVTVTESKTLTVPEGVRKISIFAVGAGGGLAHVNSRNQVSSSTASSNGGAIGGGNGGGKKYSSLESVSGFDAINAAGSDGAANTGAGGGKSAPSFLCFNIALSIFYKFIN